MYHPVTFLLTLSLQTLSAGIHCTLGKNCSRSTTVGYYNYEPAEG